MSLTVALAQLAPVAAACAQAARVDAAGTADTLLLAQQAQLAAASRLLEVASSALAAEIAHRSRPELGYDGLAQRLGARTAEKLVQQVTGTSAHTARRLVNVGTLTAAAAAHETDPGVPPGEPWLAGVLRAAAAGALSGEAVEVIRLGLGAPAPVLARGVGSGVGSGVSADVSADVTAEQLAAAAEALIALAPALTLELLAARARELRDNLDADAGTTGIAEREEERRARRYLFLSPQRDGMTRLAGLLDPESAAVLKNAIDAATSPRRGGPRFLKPEDAARAAALAADPRTPAQMSVDALVELVEVAVRAHGTTILGVRRADVRVLVTDRDLATRASAGTGTGIGFIEGQTAAVSIATVERHACGGGYVPVLFTDDGQSLNLGQTQRFHTARQRTAIAARDGGCLAPDCDRPPSWAEVHHINEYSLGGNTDLQDGVLLCKHHHLLTHNNGWQVTRTVSDTGTSTSTSTSTGTGTGTGTGDRYWWVPPPDHPDPQPIPLHSKSPALRRLVHTAA